MINYAAQPQPDLAAQIAAVHDHINRCEFEICDLRAALRTLETLADHQFVEDEMITAMDADDMASAFIAALLARSGDE